MSKGLEHIGSGICLYLNHRTKNTESLDLNFNNHIKGVTVKRIGGKLRTENYDGERLLLKHYRFDTQL